MVGTGSYKQTRGNNKYITIPKFQYNNGHMTNCNLLKLQLIICDFCAVLLFSYGWNINYVTGTQYVL